MENPNTPETLEVEKPGDKTPNKASRPSGMHEFFSGLDSVSDISNDFVLENVEVETQVVKDERVTGGTVAGDSTKFEVEKIEKICLVNDVCVDDGDKEAKLESVGAFSQSVENEAQMGVFESVVVGNVEVETQMVKDEEKTDGSRIGDSARFGVDKSCQNRDEIEEGFSVGDGCANDSEKEAKLEVDNEGVEVKGEVQDEKTSKDELLGSNGVDLPMKEEVPNEAISLYVDISGSPSGFVTEEGKNIDDQDLAFSVGDIIWVQTRNQTWWPGKICDPDDAPKYAMKSGQGSCLLVGYYGISHYAWCSPSQLKPFHKTFEETSGKNNARIFLGAVEKAVREFGGLVKLEMTCSCGSKHNRLPANSPSFEGVLKPEKCGRLVEFSAIKFEPVAFLERIKYLAEVVSMPHALDFAVIQNRLSAFYCSIGHRQLPTHVIANNTKENTESRPEKNVLRGNGRKNATKEGFESSGSRKRKMKKDSEAEVEDDGDEAEDTFCRKVETVDKGFDSRQRKKSRYLSYPYIHFEQRASSGIYKTDVTPKVASEGSTGVSQDVLSPSSLKNNGERFWKKWYCRFTGENHVPYGSDIKNSASDELLHELHCAAVNGLHPDANKGFGLVGWFVSRFRISVYHDEYADDICLKNTVIQNEANGIDDCVSGEKALEDKPKRKRSKKKENPTSVEDPSESLDETSGKDSLSTRKRKGQADSGTMKTKPLSGLSDVSISIAGIGVSVKEALQTSQPLSPCNNKPKKTKKKKGEEASVDHLKIEQTTGIPDLNGSSGVLSLGDPQVSNSVAFEGKSELVKSSDANVMNIADANAGNLSVDLQVSPGPSNDKFGLLDKDGQTISMFSELGKPMPKKRKRKRVEKVATEHIPDLNGVSFESDLVGKETQETNGEASPVAKPKRKRRRKVQVVLNYPRNQSFVGTALLLTFAPGAPTPSREDLISTFSKFGQLKESDTKVSKDPGNAQIVFVNNTDATEAFRSIEKNNPFGASLANFRLHHIPDAPSRASETGQAQPQPAPAATPLDSIKQNLQMMTAMLEKSGDNLSQEMRAKLEGEIKGLLSKVSSMAGSCS